MAKTKTKNKNKTKANVEDVPVLEAVKFWTVRYGIETVQQRALSDIRDGLKPVARRILWAMHEMKVNSKGGFKKSARVIGDVVGKYHPHGDMACYDALVKMANLAEPLVKKQGNFGTCDDPKSYAAMRYTECRLSEYADNFLLDPEYMAVVPMMPNYNGEFQEPVYLPAKLPNLLINGSEGIAMGCSSLIPSFSRKSVTTLIKKCLKSDKHPNAKICAKYLEFKFNYGGEIDSNQDDILEFFETGKGTLNFLPRIEEKGNSIKIVNIAPRFNIEKKFEAISKIKEVRRIDDNREGEKIEFVININSNLQGEARRSIINKIKAELRTSLSCQTLSTLRHDDGKTVDFKITTVPEIISTWLVWRIEFEKKVVNRLIDVEDDKLHKQKLLLLAMDNKDVIKDSLDSKDPVMMLSKKLKIEKADAEWILHLQLIRLAKIDRKNVINKIKELKEGIENLKTDLKDVNKRILNQL